MTAQRLCVMVTSSLTATTFLRGYLRFLREAGWEVTLVCSDGPGAVELAHEAGVAFEPLEMTREPSPLADLRALRQVRRLLRRLRPDVLVYATPKAALLGALGGRAAGVPRRVYEVWGLRMETASGLGRRVFAALESLTMRLSTEVIANSRSLADRVGELGLNGAREVTVLGAGSSHGVDAVHFSPRADVPALDRDVAEWVGSSPGPVVGFVGRLHPDKGIDTLLAALRVCADRGLAAPLLLVGGDEGAAPDALAAAADTRIPVHTTGFAADVRPLLRAMDVLVLPSRREGFPNVVLEAAAMEVPAIVSDATGCVDAVIDDVTGMITPVGDAGALADALITLLQDGERRTQLGAAARDRAVAEFAPETVWAQHSQRWAG
ncbi:glycosyltransferase family 4 protein [Microbacterium sp. ZOR0019]|uniref:glycosyltransferase family 4 protein n=1 Tax=Microbacterium sp. ZOR0019 TaxID=1339233 RepID=UPI000AC2B745|nr:glycosyltransferase family 4 protein [Microbacterium sp. ZOR0019]